MAVEDITSRLRKCRMTGDKQWSACCPAHDDRSPSLGVKELDDGRILINCLAGCGAGDVLESIGLTLSDLYAEPLANRVVPLYMAMREKRVEDGIQDDINSCELRLDMAQDMRSRGIPMTTADMKCERDSLIKLKRLQKKLGENNG